MKTHMSLNNKLIIIILIIIIVPLIVIYAKKNYDNVYYEVVNRDKQIEKSQKSDTDSYETVGWIKVQNTKIDEKVYSVISDLPEFSTNEERNYSWIPLQHNKLLNHETILGHNILNLSTSPGVREEDYSAFEDLMSFVYYDVAKKNKYIQYTFNGKTYLYKIFSVMFTTNAKLIKYETSVDISKDELQKEINYYQKNSIYDYDVDVTSDDKILTLDTCTRFYGTNTTKTFIVNARLVRKTERIIDYGVEKNDNYKEIENKMKGENENVEKEKA